MLFLKIKQMDEVQQHRDLSEDQENQTLSMVQGRRAK